MDQPSSPSAAVLVKQQPPLSEHNHPNHIRSAYHHSSSYPSSRSNHRTTSSRSVNVLQRGSSQDSDSQSSSRNSQSTPKTVGRHEQVLYEASIRNDVTLARKIIGAAILNHHQLERSAGCLASLHEASRRGHLEILSMLIQSNCDMEVGDKYGMRPLLIAAWSGHKAAVQMLVEAGADCRAGNRRNETILHLVAKNEQLEVLTYLLESHLEKLNINAVDKEGKTALHISTINDDVEFVDRLIKAGADTRIRDKYNRTAAHYAADAGSDEILTILLENGVTGREKCLEGKTAVHLATENNHCNAVKAMVETNCDATSFTDSKGRTALHIAAASGNEDIISILIENGSILNAKDKRGDRPLHVATSGKHPRVVLLLLQKGAHVNVTNHRQQTALHLAAELGFSEITEILLTHGADLSMQEKSGRKALYIAARGSHTAIVDMLIRAERERGRGTAPHRESIISNSSNCSAKKGPVIGSTSFNSCMGHGGGSYGGVERHISVESNETQGTYGCDSNCEFAVGPAGTLGASAGGASGGEPYVKQLKEILWIISRNHMDSQEWKKLAEYWDFSEEHIRAIEHQYTGRGSHKDHCYRMMLIWLHGIPASSQPMSDLFDALSAIGKEDVAEKFKKKVEGENSIFSTFPRRSRRYIPNCFPSPRTLCNYCVIS